MTRRARAIVFTALKLESEAVAAHLQNVEFVRRDSFIWRRGILDEGLGWEVVIVQTEPENAVAGPVVAAALSTIDPAVAMFVGIAGGLEAKGAGALDIVVPWAVEYLHAGQAGTTFVKRPRQSHPSAYMIGAARATDAARSWTARLDAKPDPDPEVHFDVLASGEQVVKSLESHTYREMLGRNDKIIAVDMEGTGFLNASGLHDHLQYLLVRGISDLISDKDPVADSERQPLAAARASAFAFEVLATTPRDVLTLRPQPMPLEVWGSPPRPLGRDDEGEGESELDGLPPADDSDSVTATLVVKIATELAVEIDLDRWHLRTEGLFFGSTPTLTVDYDAQLQSTIAWLAARLPVPGAEAFVSALDNLRRVLEDLHDVFHRHIELDRSGAFYRTEAFYRAYDRPVTEREELVDEFRRHTALVKNLGAEATRALNLVTDAVRTDHAPHFRVVDGAAGILAGDQFTVLAYTEPERANPSPYPGLAEFPAAIAQRDGVFPATPPSNDWPEDLTEQLREAVEAKSDEAAHSLAFRLAQTLAEGLPAGWSIVLPSGHERDFDVRFRVVTVQWRFADGLTTSAPVPHLARTYMSGHGPDVAREVLLGAPEQGALGATFEAGGGRLMEPLSTVELQRFSREADALAEAAGGGTSDRDPTG